MAATRSFSEDEREASFRQRAFEVQRAARAAADLVAREREAGRGAPAGPARFAHLSVRSCYSLRDGAIRPRELAAAAAAAGMSHVALTDRDGLYGVVRFAQACADEGVVPVFGTDLALAPDPDRPGWELSRAGRRRFGAADPAPRRDGVPSRADGGGAAGRGARTWGSGGGGRDRRAPDGDDPRLRRPARGPAWLEDDAPRVIVLARTTPGYADVCRAVTAAHGTFTDRPDHVRASPHLAWDDVGLLARAGGAVTLHGADSPFGRLVAAGRLDAAEGELRRWLEVLGRDGVVVGVRNHRTPAGGRGRRDRNEPGDDARIRRSLEVAGRLGIRAVATNDVRYLTPDDAPLADVLTCVRNQVALGAHHLGRVSADGWFTTAAEQAERFHERGDLLAAAHDLATGCEVDLGLGGLHVPRLTGMADPVAAGELHRRCWNGVADRFPRVTPRIRERLERELAMVDRLGLWDYFLTVADIMTGVRELGILAACRGSAAGSLICYALRISDVDPVAHDLAFERFMNPYRDELPDIDIDVESARRTDVYDLVLARYGAERTACVAMVETFQARMAIREVGKVLGLPPDEIGMVAKSFVHARARDVRGALRRLPELQGSRIDAGQLERLFAIVERIDGFPRHLALHPCGILLADTDLVTRTPLERSASRGPAHPGYPMSQFDKDDVAALGLLKLDVLGVRMLSAIRHTLDLVPHTRGAPLDLDAIPEGDPRTYELIRSARSVGMFQIESPGQQELLGRLQPDHFGDLITEISLFRPGPVKADMVTPFVKRRHGTEETTYVHPALEPALAETHGVVVYHEQVMRVLAALTGCDLSYADLLRRQLSDDRRLPALRAWVLARAVDRGFDARDAVRIWDQVRSFASFGFCKAHAAAFAVPTYRSAYLKAHYLPEFMAGLLTHDPGMYPRRLILDECRTFGVAVLPPDVNRSEGHYTVEVVDEGLADHLLRIDRDPLPPGWTRPAAPRPTSVHVATAAAVAAQRPAPDPPPRTGRTGRAAPGERPVPPSGFDAGDAGDGYRYGVRVGLQDVKGITEDEVGSLLEHRPFTSLDDVRLRAALSRPTAEHLARIGAFDHVGGLGRRDGPRDRRHLVLATEEAWRRAPARSGRRTAGAGGGTGYGAGGGAGPGAGGGIGTGAGGGTGHSPRGGAEHPRGSEQVALDLDVDHRPALPASTDAEVVREELALTGLDTSRHVVSFYEPLLDALGVVRTSELPALPTQRKVRVAGVKVALQSPQQRSGQRVLFLSLDDRTGTTQCTFFASSLEDTAWTLLHAWLVVVEGRVSRRTVSRHGITGQGGVTVTGLRAWDLSRLWRAWQQGWLDDALAERGTPAPHERDTTHPAGLTAAQWGRGSR